MSWGGGAKGGVCTGWGAKGSVVSSEGSSKCEQ